MVRFLTTLFFAFELPISPVANAEIHRWVDEQGNVNFGDRPPADSASKSVQEAPEQPQEAVTEAQERARRLQDCERQAREGREGLRFRRARTDLSFQLDRPGNDAEIVELTSNSLTFFWRRGGRIPRTNVMSISREGRGISIREFAYVRGQLSGKRFWEIDR